MNEHNEPVTDPIPGMPKVSYSRVSAEMEDEYKSLESGYNTGKGRRLSHWKQYRFQLYGNETTGQSKYVDSTIFDVISWMVPTLLQPFVQTDNLIKVDPTDATLQAIIKASLLQELLTNQIKKRLPWYNILYDTFLAGAVQGESYLKVTWYKGEGSDPVSRPVVSVVPAAGIRYDWTAQNFADSHVVIHEEDLPRTEILKLFKHGKAPGVVKEAYDRVMESHGRSIKSPNLRDEEQNQPSWVSEGARASTKSMNLFLRREQWTMYDIEGKGEAEPVLAVFLDDTLVQLIKSPSPIPGGRPPFEVFQAMRDPLGNPAFGWPELLCDVQKFKTAILRLVSDNLNAQQNGLYEVDRTNVDDVTMMLLRRAPQGARTPLPVRKPGSITPLPVLPIAAHAFTSLETMNVAGENRSGMTRYSQGLDSNSLNQTATGITQIMQRSDMRMWEVAMRFTETTLKPLIRTLIAYNQKFLDKASVQLQFGVPGVPGTNVPPIPAGQWMNLGKEDIGGFYTVDLDVDIVSDRQQKVADILQFAQFFGQSMPPEKMVALGAEVLQLMGIKNMRHIFGESHAGTRGIEIPIGNFTGGAGGEGAPEPLGGESEEAPPVEGEPGVQGLDLEGLLGGGAGAPVQ